MQSYNEFTGEGNGFSFSHYNAHDMLYTIRRSLDFFQDEVVWEQIVDYAMKMDYSWAQSAFKYNHLYMSLISRSESHVL